MYIYVISGKTLLMREKSIQLAKAGEEVLFLYDSRNEVKTLLHYKLEDYFNAAGCSGSISVVNSCSFVSYFLIVSNHLSF